MTDKEKLIKVMEKAVRNGWLEFYPMPFKSIEEWIDYRVVDNIDSYPFWDCDYWKVILFNHDFAKAYWGEEMLCYDCGEKVSKPDTVLNGRVQIGIGNCTCNRQFENNIPSFLFHLQQTMISKSPLDYYFERL